MSRRPSPSRRETRSTVWPKAQILWEAALVAVLLLGRPVVSRGAPGSGTIVSLGEAAATAQGEVMVPLFLTPDPPSLQIGALSAAIGFENKSISFIRAEKGTLLDSVNAEMQSELQKDPKDPNKSVVQIEVATKAVAGPQKNVDALLGVPSSEPRKALHGGLVVILVFKIAPDAAAGAKVSLTFDKVTATDLSSPPKPIAPLSGKNGSVAVRAPAQVVPDQNSHVACFFFTH